MKTGDMKILYVAHRAAWSVQWHACCQYQKRRCTAGQCFTLAKDLPRDGCKGRCTPYTPEVVAMLRLRGQHVENT